MTRLRFLRSGAGRISLVVALCVGMLAGVGVWQYCAADLTGPTATDHNVTNIVTMLMQRDHLSRHALNDEISERGFKSFMDGLDPLKTYFYQSDIDEFSAARDQLDDMLERSDTSFAYKVFRRFLKRMDERVATVDELLTREFDFTKDEEIITEPDLLHYPRTKAEAEERWRKRIKYDLLSLKASDKLEGKEARDKLTHRYHNFARRMKQFDNDEVLETFLSSITTSYDPHTMYMSPSRLDRFQIELGLNLEGIGAQLEDRDGNTTVARVVPGGAADKHGKLKVEDKIVSVGQGESGEMVDIVGMKLDDVVKLIRGDAGTVVRLGVIPANGHDVTIYKITRAKIQLNDFAAHKEIFDVGSKPNGPPYRVGVIDLPSFYLDMDAARRGDRNYRSSTRDVRRILDEFTQKNVDAVVLDLRRNGGGSLTEAINLTGLFINKGPIVQVMDSRDRVEQLDDEVPGMAWSGPLVVLTSKFSASASEILAGAIQDYHRGLIVGDEATHGKGTVQSLVELGPKLFNSPYAQNLGALKITMQQFFRPNGDSTQLRGVLSDIVLPSVTNYMDVGESDLDYAIDFKHVRRSAYVALNQMSPQLLAALRGASEKRIEKSADFAKLLKRIELYREQKKRTSVTLNEEKYFAERAELNAQREDEKKLEEAAKGEFKIKRDYYLNEVFSITTDYVTALKGNKLAHIN